MSVRNFLTCLYDGKKKKRRKTFDTGRVGFTKPVWNRFCPVLEIRHSLKPGMEWVGMNISSVPTIPEHGMVVERVHNFYAYPVAANSFI